MLSPFNLRCIDAWIEWKKKLRDLSPLSDCCMSAKLESTFADIRCHVVSVTDPYGRILGFLDWSCYFFFQVSPQLYS
jgi:hypothetical protein